MKQKRINYRRIYKQYYGFIPKDKDGRSYDIHHKDGNIENNDPSNLIALSLQEHYNIHYLQGDFGACWAIGKRMKIKPENFSEIVKKQQQQRIDDKNHNFLVKNLATVKDRDGNIYKVSLDDPRYINGELVGINKGFIVAKDKDGNILRIKKDDERYINGELVGANKGQSRPGNGGHGLNKGKRWKQKQKRQNIVMCPHCNKQGDASGMLRWHFNNCKDK